MPHPFVPSQIASEIYSKDFLMFGGFCLLLVLLPPFLIYVGCCHLWSMIHTLRPNRSICIWGSPERNTQRWTLLGPSSPLLSGPSPFSPETWALWPQHLLLLRPLACPLRCPGPSTTFHRYFCRIGGNTLRNKWLLRNLDHKTHASFPFSFCGSQWGRKLKRLSDWMTFPASWMCYSSYNAPNGSWKVLIFIWRLSFLPHLP